MDNNQIRMNRESRKVYAFLCDLCRSRGVEPPMDIQQPFITDLVMIKYYAAPVINLIRTHSRKIKAFEQKHGTIDYWLPMIMSMLKNSVSAIRQNTVIPDWDEDDSAIISYSTIVSNYLITDYGYDDMIMLHRIVNTYNLNDIQYACGVGRQNRVYEVRYINAILEKERAKHEIVIQRMNNIGKIAQSSDALLNDTIHEHSTLDMAQVEYNWQKAHENSDIERQFNELTRRMGW